MDFKGFSFKMMLKRLKMDQIVNLGAHKKVKKCQKKCGRCGHWSNHTIDDFIDIITKNEIYKNKLLFCNTKDKQNGPIYEKILQELKERCAARDERIDFSVNQLRTKVKKCVCDCKRAALTIKTATGIKRFQEQKGYGNWFDQLFALVKTRDSCQPEQAIEPSSTSSKSNDDSVDLEKPKTLSLSIPNVKRKAIL